MATTIRECFHCGEPIEAGAGLTVVVQGQPREFCGVACRKVATLIAERGLGRFYEFRDGPTGTAAERDQTDVERTWRLVGELRSGSRELDLVAKQFSPDAVGAQR